MTPQEQLAATLASISQPKQSGISSFLDKLGDSAIGKLGTFALDTGASMISQPYRQNLILQNQLKADEELRQRGEQYSNALYGKEASQTPYDPITQELFAQDNPQATMPQQQIAGTGFKGGQLSIADLLHKQQSNPNRTIGAAASQMLGNQLKQKTRGSVNYWDWMSMSPEEQAKFGDFQDAKRQAAVQVNTGDMDGRWGTDAEKERLGFSSSDNLWMGKNGPKLIERKSAAEVTSAVTADSIEERLSDLDSKLGKGYTPNVIDNLQQFGVPDSIVNLIRTPKGKTYVTSYNSMVADVVKAISGTAASDKEREALYNTMAYTTGDEPGDMSHKRTILQQRIKDMRKIGGEVVDEAKPVQSSYKVGDIEIDEDDGTSYKFLGGDPSKEANWSKQ